MLHCSKVFCIISLAALSACVNNPKEPTQKELALRYTDTLQYLVEQTMQNFHYTLDELQERKLDMDTSIIEIKSSKNLDTSGINNMLISDYLRLRDKYASLIGMYKNALELTEDAEIKTKTLVNSVQKDLYQNKYEQFKEEYSSLRKNTEKANLISKEISEELKVLEPMYLRLEKKIGDL